jgi:hypothetical protein
MMNRLVETCTLSLLIFVSSSASLAQERVSYREKGKVEAAENIRKEIYFIKAWGLSSSNFHTWPTRDDIYESILKDTYQISFQWVGGCLVDEETSDYVSGYNEVSKAGIEAKYGNGILEKIRQQAEVEYESKYGEKERELDKKFREILNALTKGNKR